MIRSRYYVGEEDGQVHAVGVLATSDSGRDSGEGVTSPRSSFSQHQEVVDGTPMYDHIGYVFHKQRLLWRKRLLAIQNCFLLYFTSDEEMRNNDPKYIIDMRSQVHLRMEQDDLPYILAPFEMAHIPSLSESVTFTLTGPGLPNQKEMHFQANSPDECQKWRDAIRIAIFGRCERCLRAPALFEQPDILPPARRSHCLECVRQIHVEQTRERHQALVDQLHSLALPCPMEALPGLIELADASSDDAPFTVDIDTPIAGDRSRNMHRRNPLPQPPTPTSGRPTKRHPHPLIRSISSALLDSFLPSLPLTIDDL